MTLVPVIEGGIIALAVAASVTAAARRLFPTASARLRATLAGWLDQPSRAPQLRSLGKRLAPRAGASVGCASTGGCSACGACAVAAPLRKAVIAQRPR